MCVTHLPQIAAFAEHHYFVSKHLTENETYTKIKLLNTENERIRALADLIGGTEITEQTLEMAQEMLMAAVVGAGETSKTFVLLWIHGVRTFQTLLHTSAPNTSKTPFGRNATEGWSC